VIERIRFGAGSDILVETDFSGKSMAPFRSIEGDWTAQDGMLRAPYDPQRGSENAVIAMSMKQNSPITATATLGSNERAMNFDIVLFSDDVDNGRGRNCVLATFYWGRVNVQGVHNGNHYTIGDDRFQTRDEQKMSVRLSYDPEKARIRVWVNRQEVSQYVVREPISAGSHIAVVSRGPLALERFAVIKGVVPPPSQTRTAAEDKTTVFGADGEHFAATSIRIVDNKAKMKTEYAEMEWDLKQLDEVLFATSGVKQVKPTGDAVIRTSASKFIVTLQGMDEKQVRCSSPIYSELTIDRAALREILLHEME
jgi:hypothetical protein